MRSWKSAHAQSPRLRCGGRTRTRRPARRAGAADPSHVGSTLEGCKVTTAITLPNGGGDFICPTAAYTSGNLGKSWNELDLVPFRLTLDAGGAAPATQTYSLAVVLDHEDGTPARPGYDVISALTLNTALSSAGCTAASDGRASRPPRTSAASTSRSTARSPSRSSRTPTCVYDYYGRLALGLAPVPRLRAAREPRQREPRHPGHRRLGRLDPRQRDPPAGAQQGHVGARRTPTTPGRSRRARSPTTWTSRTPATPANPRNATVAVTITWTKLAATPVGRDHGRHARLRREPRVADDHRHGLRQHQVGHDEPPHGHRRRGRRAGEHEAAGPDAHDDRAGGHDRPQRHRHRDVPRQGDERRRFPARTQATATATVQGSGHTTNGSAVITDSESIAGEFSYSADSFTPNVGSFDNGYVAGTHTTAQTDWTSASQTGVGRA